MPKRPQVYCPPGPRKPAFSPMAEPTQKIISLVRIDATGWQRQPDSSEHFRASAVLSNGDVVMERATMTYEKGERERIMERALSGTATSADLRRIQAIRDERARKAQAVYGELHKLYGKGIPA